MLRLLAICVVILLVPSSLAPPSLRAQQKEDCGRFHGVKEWIGTFTIRFETSVTEPPFGKPGDYQIFRGVMQWAASGSFKLKELRGHGSGWEGNGTATVSIDDETVYLAAGVHRNLVQHLTHTASRKGSFQIPTLWSEFGRPTLRVFSLGGECKYWVMLGSIRLDVEEFRRFQGETKPARFRYSWDLPFSIKMPLPDTGLTLKGSREVSVADLGIPNIGAGDVALWRKDNALTGTVTWSLVPGEREELELVVEPEGYDTWTPEAGKDEKTPGNDIRVRARLQTRDGKPPAEKPKRIKFELVDTSSVPGIAMNWPPKDKATRDLDLQFNEKRNPNLRIMDVKAQKAQTPEGAEYTQAEAVVSAYDWGAYGKLMVIAEMADGKKIFGHLKSNPGRTRILLPKRRDDSRIPDVVKQRAGIAGLADSDDEENDPVGDGYRGDGLSLYEEYRGFYEDGQHIRGSFTKKDLFVRDETGSRHTQAGIALFARLTGLEVRHKLRKYEIGDDRVVNFNAEKGTHRVDQHGVLLTTGDPEYRFLAGRAFGGPGTPKMVERIIIRRSRVPGLFRHPANKLLYPRLVAHELLHAVNVYHHGDDDIGPVLWRKGTDEDGKPAIIEAKLGEDGEPKGQGEPIRVFSESGEEYPPDHQLFRNPRRIWHVAVRGGKHSGYEACVMRYISASAYEATITYPAKRYLSEPDEPIGMELSNSRVGTGVNDRDRKPWPRYGDASKDRGDCIHQIRVNDRGEAPKR